MSPKIDPPRALMEFAEELKAHRAKAAMSRDELAAKCITARCSLR